MSDIDNIRNLYIELCKASINKDIDKLEELLDRDYILVHMTGVRQTKDEYINSVLKGDLEYYEVIHDSIDVEVDGNKAMLIGKTRTLASPYGSIKSWWNLKQEMKLEKINGRWVIIYSKASTY